MVRCHSNSSAMSEPKPQRRAYQGKTGILVELDRTDTGEDKHKGRDAAHKLHTKMVGVSWQWAGAILGVIPFIQFVGLLCIIKWANHVIIKDNSALSMARLLRPVVDRLGTKGCLLTGKEISEELSHPRVRYGFTEPDPTTWSNDIMGEMVRHIDILEGKQGFGIQRQMPEGKYDGDYEWEGASNTRKRKRRRVR
jgi:hypothetical protein